MILFTSSAFPVTPGQHPENADAVGLPLFGWLLGRLEGEGATIAGEAEPNDVGWTAKVSFEDRHFLIGLTASARTDDPAAADYSVLVQTVPGFFEVLTGGAPVEADDALILAIERILVAGEVAEAPTVLIDG